LHRDFLLKHWRKDRREEGVGRRGKKCKQLLDDLKQMKGYCKLKEEAVDHTLQRTHFGRGYGPVGRQTTESMNWNKRHSYTQKLNMIHTCTHIHSHS
jgi:hypothetical protein